MKRCYIVNKLEDLEFLKIFDISEIPNAAYERIFEILTNNSEVVVYYDNGIYDGWNFLISHFNSPYRYDKEYETLDLTIEIRKWKLKQLENFLF